MSWGRGAPCTPAICGKTIAGAGRSLLFLRAKKLPMQAILSVRLGWPAGGTLGMSQDAVLQVREKARRRARFGAYRGICRSGPRSRASRPFQPAPGGHFAVRLEPVRGLDEVHAAFAPLGFPLRKPKRHPESETLSRQVVEDRLNVGAPVGLRVILEHLSDAAPEIVAVRQGERRHGRRNLFAAPIFDRSRANAPLPGSQGQSAMSFQVSADCRA